MSPTLPEQGSEDGTAALLLGYRTLTQLVKNGAMSQSEAAECLAWTSRTLRVATKGHPSEVAGEGAAAGLDQLLEMLTGGAHADHH